MKRSTGQDRSITAKWRPATRAVRAGTWRSEQGETSEAMFPGGPQGTADKLRERGVEVHTFDSEQSDKGEGGPTCMTRPIARG